MYEPHLIALGEIPVSNTRSVEMEADNSHFVLLSYHLLMAPFSL